ncbi:Uncharacterised protein [Mycobacteroides abscessus subsp. massiliense]|nr:HNH endonuclease [Mycobacteroides abscessus]MDB2215640.1 HNH endonuclease [Mycobacteroides abscessus subsp. massiliense]MDO2982678.1 HNH endonuclease [Mycobacteroides abscessus subsp. abscessus]MDO3144201.1 HNH endonuclease [Mycobacteroides abscessus subsp. massiliense]MDO3303072.1 HNH endonuclease [Mycobacteroides abscessus subsp. massiliense]SHV63439.1 Uncharacterised protein [Mycobacteroides abscessus subsp. abscessus]
MTPLDEFMAKKANDYMAVVDTWRPEAGQFKDVFDEYKRWVGAPNGTEWTGRTSNAAYDTASTDCHSSDNTNDTAEDAGKLVAATIEYEVVDPLVKGQRLIERVLEHKDRGVSIDQQYHVEYHPAEGESDDSIARNREHVADIERQIKEYVAKWEQGCQTLKAQADAAAQKITGCINPKTALVDGRKILRDAVNPTPGEGPSTVTAASGKPHGIVEGMQDIAGAGDTKPAGTTGAETVADYKKWYPKDAVPVGDKNVDPAKLGGVGSLPGVRDGSDKTSQPLQRAVLRPEQVEQFKADTRKLLQGQGVPADQIESRVNAAVQSAQNPHFMPDADPMRTPGQVPLHNSPGDQFNDIVGRANDEATKTIDGQIEQAKILTGQAGPGAPGVAEAWKDVGLGAVKQVHELTSDPLAAPKMGIEQAKEFYNHPGEFIGKNLIHGTEALAGGAVGGEAAAGARGLLGDLTGTEGRALTHGLDNPHPAPTVEHGGGGGGGGGIGGDHTSGVGDHGGGPGGHGMPGGNPTPFDFDTPIDTARPEFNIPNPVEVMSPELRGLVDQHLTGSGETVIGPYAPRGGGPSYIDVAQQRGASYFDIGDAWNSSTPTQQLASNQYALDMAVKNGDTIRLSVPFYRIDPSTFTGAEIRYFESHGYQRMGDNLLIPPTGGTP